MNDPWPRRQVGNPQQEPPPGSGAPSDLDPETDDESRIIGGHSTVPQPPGLRLRRLGLVVLAAFAVVVYFTMQPATDVVLASADFRAELNAELAESAPQQQVVNGWATRDLLEIAIRQEETQNNRTAALLAIGVLAIALWGATAVPQDRPRTRGIPV